MFSSESQHVGAAFVGQTPGGRGCVLALEEEVGKIILSFRCSGLPTILISLVGKKHFRVWKEIVALSISCSVMSNSLQSCGL